MSRVWLGNQIVVNAEVAFTFTGLQAVLKNPPVHVVQKPRVCLDCGLLPSPFRRANCGDLEKAPRL